MAAFTSPLHLVPEADHDGLTDQYIKRLRKELLLRFELENQTEISVNGLLYDKDRVIKTIEALRSNLQEHIWLFQQTSLLAFLEKLELQFFANPKDWQSLDHADFGGWLWPYFSSQLSVLIFKLVATKDVSSTRTLKQIFDYDFHLSGDRADDVYQSAFAELMRFIQGAGEVSSTPFRTNYPSRLKREAGTYFDPYYITVFNLLPSHFTSLKETYALKAIDFLGKIIHKHKQQEIERLPRSELQIIYDAIRIAIRLGGYRDLGALETYLHSILQERKPRSAYEFFGIFGIMIVIVLIGFTLLFGGSSKNSQATISTKPNSIPAVPELVGDWSETIFANDLILDNYHILRFGRSTGEELIYRSDKGQHFCLYVRPFDWHYRDSNLALKFKSTEFETFCQTDIPDKKVKGIKTPILLEKEDTLRQRKLVASWPAGKEQLDFVFLTINKKGFQRSSSFLTSILNQEGPNRLQNLAYTLQLKSFAIKATHQYSYAMRSKTTFSFEDETFRIKHQGVTYTLADITQQQTSFFLRPNIWRIEKTTDLQLGTFKKINYLDDFRIRKEGPITFYFDAQNKFPYCVERQWYALSSMKNGNS